MGKRGPAKKPTALKKLNGSARHNPQRIPENEPEPRRLDCCPQAPARLDDDAVAYWDLLAPLVYDMGLLTEADLDAMADLCYALAARDKAETEIAEKGEVVNTHKGPARSQWVFYRRDMVAEIHKLRSKFGLTPSDRAGMSVATKSTKKKPGARFELGADE